MLLKIKIKKNSDLGSTLFLLWFVDLEVFSEEFGWFWVRRSSVEHWEVAQQGINQFYRRRPHVSGDGF
jgi:hypothetical protein